MLILDDLLPTARGCVYLPKWTDTCRVNLRLTVINLRDELIFFVLLVVLLIVLVEESLLEQLDFLKFNTLVLLATSGCLGGLQFRQLVLEDHAILILKRFMVFIRVMGACWGLLSDELLL